MSVFTPPPPLIQIYNDSGNSVDAGERPRGGGATFGKCRTACRRFHLHPPTRYLVTGTSVLHVGFSIPSGLGECDLGTDL